MIRHLTGIMSAAILIMPFVANAGVTYSDRVTFGVTLNSTVVDDYENAGYGFVQTDATMSAVLGETQYTTTSWTDHNLVFEDNGEHKYCAGCNGSFLLDFTSTSVGDATGVYGVGFEYFNAGGPLYYAFIMYGDGSTENVALGQIDNNPTGPLSLFFGVTSDLLVSSIHLGLMDGGTTSNGFFGIDNLTIGSAGNVPIPASLALLGLGLFVFGFQQRSKIGAA